jgi:hypothetical protein
MFFRKEYRNNYVKINVKVLFCFQSTIIPYYWYHILFLRYVFLIFILNT